VGLTSPDHLAKVPVCANLDSVPVKESVSVLTRFWFELIPISTCFRSGIGLIFNLGRICHVNVLSGQVRRDYAQVDISIAWCGTDDF
jgi:hypothetical protein